MRNPSVSKTPPTLETLRAYREEIIAAARRNKAFNVRVFGSVARGNATFDSDIDLLVNFGEGASLYDLAGLQQDLQELLGYSVDVVEDHPGLREHFRRRVAKDAVTL